MRTGLVLLALLGSATAQTNEKWAAETYSAATNVRRHFIGTGRAADARLNFQGASQSAPCNAKSTYSVKLVYTESGGMDCPYIPALKTCENITNTHSCIPVRPGEKMVCRSVVKEEANAQLFYTSAASTSGLINALGNTLVRGDHVRAHGTASYEWFAEVTVNVALAESPLCTVTLNAFTMSSAIIDVTRLYCTKPQDQTFAVEETAPVDYFATGAQLPRHTGNNYIIDNKVVGGDHADQSRDHESEVWWSLGKGPLIELSCLNLYVTAADYNTPAACKAVQTFSTLSRASYEFDVVEAPDCRFAPGSAECCARTTAQKCGEQNGCMWVATAGECYNAAEVRYTDLRSLVMPLTSNTNQQSVYTFESKDTNTPKSSLLTRREEIEAGWEGVQNKRWFLRYKNNLLSGVREKLCQQVVTISSISHTTGGICEPSARALCDATELACSKAQPADYPRYWEQVAPKSEVLELFAEDKYQTCNCLKQKEICYRKNGCLSTKKYELILQNCVEAGCGTVCNSAGVVHLSVTVALIALLAILL